MKVGRDFHSNGQRVSREKVEKILQEDMVQMEANECELE